MQKPNFMNKENIEKIMKSVEPIMAMTAESNIQVKTLTKHYIKSMSELMNKSEDEIKAELKEIHSEVKQKEIEKIEKNYGNKS